MRIVLEEQRRVRLEADDLRIRPVRLADSGDSIVRTQTNLARIQMDGRHLRRLAIGWRQDPCLHLLDLLLTLLGTLATDAFRDPLHVLGADGQFPPDDPTSRPPS